MQQSIMRNTCRTVLHVSALTETPLRLTLERGHEKGLFRVVVPAPPTYYAGPLVSCDVSPAAIGITRYPLLDVTSETPSHCCPRVPGSDTRIALAKGTRTAVVLYLHGGAFVMGNGRDASMEHVASTLLLHSGVTDLFAPAYRLACRPQPTPFPGALQDALTSYLYLLQELQIPAGHITLSGDSAGATLAIALLRYITEFGDALRIPRPRNAVLISPWVDLSACFDPDENFTSNPNYSTDFLPLSFLRWGATAYSRIVPLTDPYISPLGRPFNAHVPIFVNLGEAEIMEMEGSRWVAEMRDAGNNIEVNYESNAPHASMALAKEVGWSRSAANVAVRIGDFILQEN